MNLTPVNTGRPSAEYMPKLQHFVPPPSKRVKNDLRPSTSWRYDRVYRLCQKYRTAEDFKASRNDDPLVVNYLLPFMYVYGTKSDDVDGSDELRAAYPDLMWAFETYRDHPYVRFLVEALLLSGTSMGTIADELYVREASIWWYERTFFNVADRLDNNNWLSAVVLGAAVRRGLALADWLWKFAGRAYGPDIVWGLSQEFGGVPDEVLAELRKKIAGMSALNALEASVIVRPNPFNVGEVMDAYYRSIDAEMSEAEKAETAKNIGIMMSKVRTSVKMAQLGDTHTGVERRDKEEWTAVFELQRRANENTMNAKTVEAVVERD